MLRYKIAPKCLLPGPFGHSDVGGNPGVAGRFVAIISFLHTPVRDPPQPQNRPRNCRKTADFAPNRLFSNPYVFGEKIKQHTFRRGLA